MRLETLLARAHEQTFDPRQIRLSEAGQCGRRQTLRALGYTPTPHTARELAIFDTGHWVEDKIAEEWESRYPGQVNRQIEVMSEFGTGHIEIYVEPLNHIVEVKTTTEKQIARLPLSSHVAQVTLHLHYWGQAWGSTAEIVYYVKETGQTLSFPVTYDPQRARELVVGLMEVKAAIELTGEPLPIPDDYQATSFPCAWYTLQGLMKCGFWAYCWGAQIATEPDKKDVVAVAPPLQADVQEYAQVRQQLQAVKTQEEILETRRDQLEAGFGCNLGSKASKRTNLNRKGDDVNE